MYQLAEINIARMLAPLDDPLMAGFVEKLDEINALADGSPGFVWRLQSDQGNTSDIRAYADERILINMSTWASLEAFTAYAYKSAHREVMKQRRRWFERFDGPYMALWWVPQGHYPTIEEGQQRLEHLRQHGESAYAFSLKHPFAAPDTADQLILPDYEECPA